MSTFISLIEFTEQGAKQISQTTKRAETFRQMAGDLGVSIKDVYWTLGAYDGVLIFEAPDDESATAAMLALSVAGNVHPKTLRAFDKEQMEGILKKAL